MQQCPRVGIDLASLPRSAGFGFKPEEKKNRALEPSRGIYLPNAVIDNKLATFKYNSVTVIVWQEIGNRHHLPHCHVEWGDKSASVTLPLLERLAGDPMPKRVRRIVLRNVKEIYRKWEKLNKKPSKKLAGQTQVRRRAKGRTK